MSRPAADSVEQPVGWVIVAASLAIITMAVATNYLIVVGIKPMADSMGWPRWVSSSAYSALTIGSGVGGILIGLWTDKRGIGGPLALAGLSIGGGTMLISQLSDPALILAACFVFLGMFGNGAVFSPLIANATRWFDRRRGIAVAIVMGGQNLAGAVWAPVFRHGIETLGWRETWFAYGCLAVVTILPLSLLLRRRPPMLPAGTAPPAERHAVATSLSPLLAQGLLCGAIIGCCVAMAMPLVHVVAYCSDLGYGLDEGAQVLSLLLACGFLSRLGFGWLSDRIGGLKTIFLGAALQAAALALFTVIDSLTGIYLAAALFGLVFGGIVPSYALATRQLFPARQAAARIGVIFMAGYIGMGGGGALGGVIFDLTLDYKIAFTVGVVFNVINLLCLSLILASRRPNAPPILRPAE